MLFGEYAVLAGAWSCALPVKFRQNFEVSVKTGMGRIQWQSFDFEGKEWMNCHFSLADEAETLASVIRPLHQMLRLIAANRPDLCSPDLDLHVRIKASFRKEWGLGSSSALIANLAHWSQTDPFALMDVSFPGSGYDVAAAFQDVPLLYRIDENKRTTAPLPAFPEFLSEYRVVFLVKKVNSRESVFETRERIPLLNEYLPKLNRYGMEALQSTTPATFNHCMLMYEEILADTLGLEPTGSQFADYQGLVKSLGAWGGDAVLVEYVPGDFEDVFGHLTSFRLGEIARWK